MRALKSYQVQKAQSLVLVAAFLIASAPSMAIQTTPSFTRAAGTRSATSTSAGSTTSRPGAKSHDSAHSERLGTKSQDTVRSARLGTNNQDTVRTNNSARPLAPAKTMNTSVTAANVPDDNNGAPDLSHLLLRANDSIAGDNCEHDSLAKDTGMMITSGADTNVISGGLKGNDIRGEQTVRMKLTQGTAFVAHKKTVILSTPNADIRIAPGAVAYVVQMGKEVSVYNFSDNHRGDIQAILPSNKTISVAYGHHLLLTKNVDSEFETITPLKSIVHSSVKNIGMQEGMNLFDTQFAPVSALNSAIEFKRLSKSAHPDDRKVTRQVLKSAAIIANLRGQ